MLRLYVALSGLLVLFLATQALRPGLSMPTLWAWCDKAADWLLCAALASKIDLLLIALKVKDENSTACLQRVGLMFTLFFNGLRCLLSHLERGA